ncbi:NAD-dependent succinate-semialdehyde dehydrogenase [Palleronia sp. LCG004]|uniref:NAD-dependent succinate-semialdehyde dehydrogenase n=1 Tax=Palleronia sp. LCG004 TaxID=3079304 RepID=UPI002943D2AE|nr:NAD-dependent succinate-semialdehyde dehydrogenase [Palleronia sp. LCG004]WOI55727.1 NAD-dependent succinate-semialdehyde dehydrogenase [Palleronia sp. LCG004]
MFDSTNPATGEKVATHPELTDDELEERIAKAHATFRSWRNSSYDERTALLDRIADVYEANVDDLALTITKEMGKPIEAAKGEIRKSATAFRYYAKNGPALLEPKEYDLGDGKRAVARYLPQGVVLAVMPWNFPHWQVVRFLAPAIMAGNVGLLKHASICQGVAQDIERIVLDAGAPEGLFQNLAIKSDKVDGVIADDRIVAATLTGSEGAGRAVAASAGHHLKKVVLELGGSDPFIVMPSADMDAAVEQAVTARVQNAGQSCICGKRLILHADIHDDFLARYAEAMKAVKVGDPMDSSNDIGPLSSFDQRDTVVKQLEDAKSRGATLMFGGEALDGPGAYMSPGILTGVDPKSDLMSEEIFGPVMMVFRADNIDEAIEIANAIPFGLGSSVWTEDAGERERFIRDIEAGMTAINQITASAPEAPFGGVKRSGHGRELGPHGLHEFMNLKTVFLSD